jgi:LTXXQ motif family protein
LAADITVRSADVRDWGKADVIGPLYLRQKPLSRGSNAAAASRSLQRTVRSTELSPMRCDAALQLRRGRGFRFAAGSFAGRYGGNRDLLAFMTYFFYFALWPWDYWYYDPFWAYGYGDIYEAVFFPYSYGDYIDGPRAPERMARLKQSIVQGCNEEAGEVTGWPIDQIQSALQPDQHQGQLLDDLDNAIVKASDEIRAHCPNDIAFTPIARLDHMHQRLQTLVDAANTVSAPLSGFYDSLSDEQKARFNDIAPRSPHRGQNGQRDLTAASVRGQCDAGMMAWPTEQIDRVVRPDDAQRGKLQNLQSAASQAADTIKAACPAEVPATPPARVVAVGHRLQAMLQGVETMQQALADFYNSLSDDQKARFNSMGRQLFAQNASNR